MRVLHLPRSAGSQISFLVRALRDMGVDARGIVHNNSLYELNASITNYEVRLRWKHPVRTMIQVFTWFQAFASAVRWADVVHWHFCWYTAPGDIDLKYISLLKKPAIVEVWGSDVRIPEIASVDNPYYEKLIQTDRIYQEFSRIVS